MSGQYIFKIQDMLKAYREYPDDMAHISGLLRVFTRFLASNGLASEDIAGRLELEGDEFELRTDSLTDEGNRFVLAYLYKWIGRSKLSAKPFDERPLERALLKFRESNKE